MNGAEGTTRAPGLSPREVLAAVDSESAILIDIRPGFEISYRVFDVPDVICVARAEIAEKAADLPRGRLLIVADAVGLHAGRAAMILVSAGFERVAWLVGGMVDWEKDGLPVRKDLGFELRGQCGCKLRPRGTRQPGDSRD
jgi:rhodanese-related sulfurtransferase